ncbi:gas vesicle protein GvpG [Umezakia ovalisporum]|jgi:hypothetical protein|uniref:Gas vesicle protein GvpG n=2 Tax=Umezakia ovalisporum TaxID=75695 RepID=A0AA43H0L9_9CYAN|nr:gas vesicle protein GvpG [Umezakia ovalisporum]MBI1240589.1 gas vesicle protein GvpG [Nostoc sp. RI_552]MDH6055513.1 gas vesicle protein GvpG [Umezakia ovalisporum FSS-43]MDH6065269.1 gas vesicle protein GvpG [Umezakia ovalisporum FSS-62]MDH6067118.1 gas vesicle protein GvpG [Umezakia ovalisporum APH033B]MDH6070029.1 gas vesicle protein GvpG [Umezakia ovalisporum CobakiLakeA]
MLLKALLTPIMGPISGVVWIAEQIQERANTEFDEQENLNKQLLALQLSFDMGEISEEEYEAQEEEILLRMQALEAESREDEALEEEPQSTVQFEQDGDSDVQGEETPDLVLLS